MTREGAMVSLKFHIGWFYFDWQSRRSDPIVSSLVSLRIRQPIKSSVVICCGKCHTCDFRRLDSIVGYDEEDVMCG